MSQLGYIKQKSLILFTSAGDLLQQISSLLRSSEISWLNHKCTQVVFVLVL